MSSYPFKKIENKWQSYWEQNNVYRVIEDYSKPKFYILDMFPYPSGSGLHIGHPEGYTASDIVSRYKRMLGYNVLHPMGFDAFGLPTERYSMLTGIHPETATRNNIETFKRQLRMLGFDYDWSREIHTSDPSYYKWTQWMFTLIYNSWYDDEQQRARHIEELPLPENLTNKIEIENYKDEHRLAYIAMMPVNWCEELGTVLANEESEEWRAKGYTIVRKPMRQWMLRITKYAQRLLDDLNLVDWPHSTMEMQINWIGKSEGVEITFQINNSDKNLSVFTTRPDTVFGATYIVLAPEHKLVKEITAEHKRNDVWNYIEQAAKKSELERTELMREKSGVFTGAFAINPATGKNIPVWIADYVLAHYGTGAIMAVPGHDTRDHEFARFFNLPIAQVVAPADDSSWNIVDSAYIDDGISINSENAELSINGLKTVDAINKTIQWLESKKIGCKKIQYKLRDWLFSRQRYWGEPIPIMYFEDGTKRCLDLDELPLVLPEITDFKPSGTGESPLANIESWINFTDKKTGKKARLETNTMPQWAGSCWYYLRYLDPKNNNEFCNKNIEQYWMSPDGVDLYIGGSEHAVLHLLYARFWHKVLFDYGYVSSVEPFKKLFHQGLIMGEDGRKMSKSLSNVINPDDVVNNYGADSLRIFEMFLGPLEASKPWSTTGIEGVNRFLNRVWRLFTDNKGNLSDCIADIPLTAEQDYMLNFTIKKVADDIESLNFNTAISHMMIFVNEFTKAEIKPLSALNKFVLCLAPFAPHLAEELWRLLGNETSVVTESFPVYDQSKIIRNNIEFVIQVNSKIRSKISVPINSSQEEIETLAKLDDKVIKYINGKIINKVIFVPNKLLNYITS